MVSLFPLAPFFFPLALPFASFLRLPVSSFPSPLSGSVWFLPLSTFYVMLRDFLLPPAESAFSYLISSLFQPLLSPGSQIPSRMDIEALGARAGVGYFYSASVERGGGPPDREYMLYYPPRRR